MAQHKGFVSNSGERGLSFGIQGQAIDVDKSKSGLDALPGGGGGVGGIGTFKVAHSYAPGNDTNRFHERRSSIDNIKRRLSEKRPMIRQSGVRMKARDQMQQGPSAARQQLSDNQSDSALKSDLAYLRRPAPKRLMKPHKPMVKLADRGRGGALNRLNANKGRRF